MHMDFQRRAQGERTLLSKTNERADRARLVWTLSLLIGAFLPVIGRRFAYEKFLRAETPNVSKNRRCKSAFRARLERCSISMPTTLSCASKSKITPDATCSESIIFASFKR